MAAVFLDRKGVLMVEFMHRGATLSEVYCETPNNCAGLAIQKKAWNVEIRCSVPAWQRSFTYKCLHSSTAGAFRLGVTPSNYHLFTNLKNWLRSQLFSNNDELMEGVRMWLSSQAADFFDIDIQKLTLRYYKCLNSGGDYVEK
jgi:hypothetical protein